MELAIALAESEANTAAVDSANALHRLRAVRNNVHQDSVETATEEPESPPPKQSPPWIWTRCISLFERCGIALAPPDDVLAISGVATDRSQLIFSLLHHQSLLRDIKKRAGEPTFRVLKYTVEVHPVFPITELRTDLLAHVFSLLKPRDLAHVAILSRVFRSTILNGAVPLRLAALGLEMS